MYLVDCNFPPCSYSPKFERQKTKSQTVIALATQNTSLAEAIADIKSSKAAAL